MLPSLLRSPVWRGPYAAIVVFGLIGLGVSSLGLTSQNIALLTFVLIYSIVVLGFGFLWGQAGQLNIAHAAVFGVGAYASAIANEHDLPFLVGTLIAAGAGGLAGAIVSLPAIRTHGHYFIILTFAIGEVAVYGAGRWNSVTGGLSGKTVLVSPGSSSVLGIDISARKGLLQLSLLFAVIIFAVTCALVRSRWGTTLRGIRDNPNLARALGTNVILHRILAFGVSGALAGIGGQLYAFQSRYIEPDFFNTHISIVFMLMAVIGGNAYLLGPVIGAVVYEFLPEVLPLSPHNSAMLFGALLILSVLLFPSGIVGATIRLGNFAKHRRRQLRGDESTAATEPAAVEDFAALDDVSVK